MAKPKKYETMTEVERRDWDNKQKQQQKNYRKKNLAHLSEKAKKWRQENPERVKELRSRWQKENPDKTNDSTRKWASKNKAKRNQYMKELRASHKAQPIKIDKGLVIFRGNLKLNAKDLTDIITQITK